MRRTGALLMLLGFFLPVMTIQGCRAGDPEIEYRGYDLVAASPLVVAIPVYAAAVLAASFLFRRLRTALGRLLTALTFLAGAGLAAVVAWAGFLGVPDFADGSISLRPGFWLLLVGALGAVGSDVAESVAGGRGWLAFVRAHPVPRLADGLVKGAARGLYALAVLLALAAAVPAAGLGVVVTQAVLESPSKPEDITEMFQAVGFFCARYGLVMVGLPLLWGAWSVLTCLTMWGIRRGQAWAARLARPGLCITVVLAGLTARGWAWDVTEGFAAWGNLHPAKLLAAPPGGLAAMALIVVWLSWSLWAAWVVLVSRRWLFPAGRVRVLLPEGQRWVHMPRCDGCSARLWLSEDAAELICRSCGSVYRAAIRGPQVVATRTQQA